MNEISGLNAHEMLIPANASHLARIRQMRRRFWKRVPRLPNMRRSLTRLTYILTGIGVEDLYVHGGHGNISCKVACTLGSSTLRRTGSMAMQ
jgi:hypothetical protein